MPLILSGDTGVPASGMPTGSVIQTVTATTATQTQSTNSTYIDTAVTASITPQFSTSKILIITYLGQCGKTANDTQLNLRIQRSSTTVFSAAALNQNAAALLASNITLTYLDSPATTSSITYTVQMANRDSSGTVTVNGNSTATITLQEIKG